MNRLNLNPVTTVGNMSFARKGEQMIVGMERDMADAAANSIADYFQHPVLLNPDKTGIDQIAELTAMGHPSVKIFLSFRRFDRDVSGFLRAMSQAADVGSVVLLHCEDAAIMGCCADRLQDQGLTEHRHYPETRPVEAERRSELDERVGVFRESLQTLRVGGVTSRCYHQRGE